jgi:hypothetical protein
MHSTVRHMLQKLQSKLCRALLLLERVHLSSHRAQHIH